MLLTVEIHSSKPYEFPDEIPMLGKDWCRVESWTRDQSKQSHVLMMTGKGQE